MVLEKDNQLFWCPEQGRGAGEGMKGHIYACVLIAICDPESARSTHSMSNLVSHLTDWALISTAPLSVLPRRRYVGNA